MDKTTFGILTIIFNCVGVPCFIQKKVSTGVWRIILLFLTCGVVGLINEIKGIILGIQVLKMTEEDFRSKFGTIDSGVPAM